MDKLPSLIPPGPPRFVAPPGSFQEEIGPARTVKQLRSIFRDAFDTLGGAQWLCEFATKNDQNARVFVQALSKLLPPQNDDKQGGGVIIDVPWLTGARLSYKRQGDDEIVDVQIKQPSADQQK